jgi:hypothetical protein
MKNLIFGFSKKTVIDTSFNFDHVSLIDTIVSFEGNIATFDVSAEGNSVTVDVVAAVTDGSSIIDGYIVASS